MTLTSNKRIPVLIDCDPGADDFFALIWAMIMHKRGYIDIVAITTSGGNVPAQSTYENVIRASMMMGVETRIGKGKDKVGAENASHIHGNDGIGGLSSLLDKPKTVEHYDSHDLMIDIISKYGNELSILCFGPVSNLAAVEKKQPGLLKQVKQTISMGGVFFKPGNVAPTAEFNYWYDPESIATVVDAGSNLVIMPLDLTTKQAFRQEHLKPVLDHVNHETHRKFLYELTEFTIRTNMGFRETHMDRGFYVHDANTVGFLLYPHIYTGTYYKVQVETKGDYTKGSTVVDVRNFPKTDTNAFVVLDMKTNWFLEAMTEDFKDFDFENPYKEHQKFDNSGNSYDDQQSHMADYKPE